MSHALVKYFAWHCAMSFGADKMGRRPSEAQDKFIVRLPDGMRDQLKAAAEANNRTMTAEVVARLRSTLDSELKAQVPDFTSGFFVDTVEREFSALRSQIGVLVDGHETLVAEVRKLRMRS